MLRRIFLSKRQDKRRVEKTTHCGTLNCMPSVNNRHIKTMTLVTRGQRNVQQWVSIKNVNQSRYRPGVGQRVPGS